ncbi:ATP-dependent DNA ligase [Actinocatenispora thailandica]|uniref:DNA ligase (ATP) n=1 Tax=Actinocatenispora thailandica TaxID=227318 RepID=A0A7R7DXP2_9ACTN|nr:non-homologous end-joining DNA ligase [Actinocatenispora thailandica]BCJ39317.1 ATP-dependent DNA ligase [Actinocatenispora thailandica]
MAGGYRPMLAVAGELPTGPGWSYEFKWDGIRAIAEISGGRLRLSARSGADITVAYPELAGLAALPGEPVLDGEIAVLGPAGPSFAALAERMHVRDEHRAAALAARLPVTYLIFDLLRVDGTDLTAEPYRVRRAALHDRIADGPRWLVPPVFDDGAATWAAAEENGLEGVVAKRLDSRYRPDRRSADWVKVKRVHHDDLVVGGYRPGARAIGALLVGEYDGTGLRYRGRVGGGISAARERELLALLAPLAADTSPFADPVPAEDARGAHWVTPQIVVEVRYGNRTADGRLRFPRLHRVRTDREAP